MSTDYKKIAEENIKKYGTDIGRFGPVLLAHLYSDRTHFIYEILQNAEDAGARAKKSVCISFHLFQDRLEIRHNGKLFDEADVRGICGLVEGTKKDDLTQIGKFGIGFKSVYAYTSSPQIHSGDETFCIEDYVRPRTIEKAIDIRADETLFIFPLNHSEVLPEVAFNEISKRLREIGVRTLLFLNYIEEISWRIDGQEAGNYIRDINKLGTNQNHKKIYVISYIGKQIVKDEEWLIFERPLQLNTAGDTNLKVEVAFKIEKGKNDKEIIVPATDSKLIVFFPTEKPTYLNFLIQGPYKTTPTRENIPSEDTQNKIIINETAELVAQSISVVKELGYLDTNFLNVLPLESKHCESEPIYDHIFKKVKEKFLTDEKLLPTHGGKFEKAKNILLARGKELANLFDGDDINFLFSKRCWADTNITSDRTRELRDYLIKELQVNEVDFEDFAKKVTADFFILKNDEWMISFYKNLLDQPSLWEQKAYLYSKHQSGVLRGKPIIRLEDNSHIAPFESGEIRAYLPTEYKSEYPTVKKVFIENEGALDFLKKLGLRSPDLFDEIIRFTLPKFTLPKKERKPDDEEYFNDFDKVLTFFNETDSNIKKDSLISKLSDTPFVLSTDNEFKKPDKIYMNAVDLLQYFEGHDSVFFVSEKLNDRFKEKCLMDFLKKIGVKASPKRIEFDPHLSEEEKNRLRKNSHRTQYSPEEVKDFELDGLKNFLCKQLNLEKSVLLWNILLKNLGMLVRSDALSFFSGVYKYESYGSHQILFDSKFLKTLKTTKWLIDKEGNLKSPSEITFSELPDRYPKEALNIEVLREKLHFKPDIFDQLPEDSKYILKLAEGLSREEVKEAFASFGKKKESETKDKPDVWIPECKPVEVDINIEDISPVPIDPLQLEGQAMKLAEEEAKDSDVSKEKESEKKELSLIEKKAIGKWGERQVFNAIRERFEGNGKIEDTDFGFRVENGSGESVEVFWLNMKSEKGVGYDFVIKMNNEEKEYIEVKSKLAEEPELVEITGTQFEFARKLNDESKGDKYWIYIVVNTGKSEAKIKRLNNPVKLWKDGKLRAHPVHFWL